MNKKSDLYKSGTPAENAEEKKQSSLSEKERNRIEPSESLLAQDSEDYWLDEEEPAEDSEDYWLDEEEPAEDSEDYWLDDEDDFQDNVDEDDMTADISDSWEDMELQVEEADDLDVSDHVAGEENADGAAGGIKGRSDYDGDMKALVKKKKPGSAKSGKKTTKKKSEHPQNSEVSGEQKASVNKQATEKKKGKGLKIFGIVVLVLIIVLGAAYAGISVFFMSHFYPNTEINGKDFSFGTVEDVDTYIKGEVQNYTLTIVQKKNETDVITAEDISLVHEENDEITSALEEQNPFLWPMAFFSKKTENVTVEVSYDKEALNEKLESIKSMRAEKIPAVSAYPKFDGEQFVIEPEVTGTDVNKDVLMERAEEYINAFLPELDMEKEKCYVFPKYTSESKEVKDACDEANKYLKASITYPMSEDVVVDKTLISQWVTVDENLTVTFNEEEVRTWMAEFGKMYDTVGSTRTITTPYGKTVEVSGGTYGWEIDEEAEFTALVNSIKNGEVATREPAYVQTAASHGAQDWGSTYAEVDISAQHMWFISNGAVVLETDVVTGVPIPSRETPSGVYSILEMERNKTLVGEKDPETGKPEYETPVAYWMRVTWSGIGFHDATWQYAFGGTRYADGWGSHGCINMPYNQAAALYDLISVGTPVIVHY